MKSFPWLGRIAPVALLGLTNLVTLAPSASAVGDTGDNSWCGGSWGDNNWCKSQVFHLSFTCSDLCDTFVFVNGQQVAVGRTTPFVHLNHDIVGDGFFNVQWISCDPWGSWCGAPGQRLVKLDFWNPTPRITFPNPVAAGVTLVVGGGTIQVQGEDQISGVARMDLRINGALRGTWVYPPETWARITENFDWACPIGVGVPQVLNNVELTVRDSAGNSASVSRSIERVPCTG